MPLSDSPEFQAWLSRRNNDRVGRRHGDPTACTSCAAKLDPQLAGDECLVCLAEQYGTQTAETWLAEALAGFIRAAADPQALARMIGELVVHARDLAEIHAPTTTRA